MHVLEIPSWYPKAPGDALGSFFRDQATSLAARGNQVGVLAPRVLSLRQVTELRRRAPGEEVDHGVATSRGRILNPTPGLPLAAPALFLLRGEAMYRRYVGAHGRPDVLHAHSLLNGGVLAAHLSRRYGVPFVVTEHSSAFVRGVLKPWQLRLATRTARRASALVAVSESFADILGRTVGGQWECIPNIVSSQFTDAPLTDPAPGGFTLCSASLMTPNKGLDLLLEAFARARQGDDRLRIAGDGPVRGALADQAAALGIAEHVEFLGALPHDEVADLMRSSHGYVLTSHVETFGVVLVEALALGRPVIATRCGGPDSIVTPDDGYLVDVGSVEQLATAITELRSHRARFDAQALRDRCIARFGERAVAEQLEELYRRVVRDSGDPTTKATDNHQ